MVVAGLTALGSLDGSPIAADDARCLGLVAEPGAAFVLSTGMHPALTHARKDSDGAIVAFLGRTNPPGAHHALLDAANDAQVGGEWVTVAWQVHDRSLRVRASDAVGMPLYLATDGARVALAPTLRQLARLDWVGSALDHEGLMYGLGRAPLRVLGPDRTVLQRVRRIDPGTTHEVRRHRHVVSRAPEVEPPSRFCGSFETGVAQLRYLLEAGVARDLRDHASVAVELSGGLDSSALAWLIAGQRRDDQEVTALTSVAPPGSPALDERAFATAVAERFGFRLALVWPDPTANVYRPSDASFALTERPLIGPRHYLYEALHRATLEHGATATLNGLAGEYSLTRYRRMMGRADRLRAVLRRRSTVRPASAFHLRVRDHVVASCPPIPEICIARPAKGTAGLLPGWEASFLGATARLDGTARYTPFRDPAVVTLAASFPNGFFERDGFDRAIVRAMTAGALPDVVRLRRDKAPFSPDYFDRLRRDAPSALDRLDHHRTTAAAEWLDLDWLEARLRTIDDAALTNAQASEIQLTATTAEWFDWWERENGPAGG